MPLTPHFRRYRNTAHDVDTAQEMDMDAITQELAEMDLAENQKGARGKKRKGKQPAPKQKPKTQEELELENLKAELDERLEQYQALNPKHYPPARQSPNEKAEHLAGLTPEGVAGEMLAAMIFHLFASILNLSYIEQKCRFAKAQQVGKAYEQRADGTWPEIYPIGRNGKPYVPRTADGKIDWTQINTDGSASRQAIRANGLVPPPSLKEAYEMHLADFMLDMNGANSLTSYQRSILNIAEQARDKVEHDAASDRLAMMKPAVPTARTK